MKIASRQGKYLTQYKGIVDSWMKVKKKGKEWKRRLGMKGDLLHKKKQVLNFGRRIQIHTTNPTLLPLNFFTVTSNKSYSIPLKILKDMLWIHTSVEG